jgi:hypothetical protein
MAPSRDLKSFAFVAVLICCSAAQGGEVVSKLTNPDHPLLLETAALTDCFGYEFSPAVIETITEKTPLAPARLAVDIQTGKTTVIREATFKTVTVQRIVTQRQEQWFPAVCPQTYTEKFVQSLQRALNARGFYSGELTGWMDEQTNLAVKLYQRKDQIDSSILALATAEEFGLISHSDFNSFTK